MREGILSGSIGSPSRSWESRVSGGGGGGGSRGGQGGGRRGQGGNSLGRGLFLSLGRGGRNLGIGQAGTGRVLYPWKESGNGGVAPIGEVGGLPGGGVRLSERLRVAIGFVGGVIMSRKVGM